MLACGGITAPCDRCEKFKPEERIKYGCDGPAPVPLWSIDEKPVHDCPGRLLREDPEVQGFLRLHFASKLLHCLPAPGCLLDQPDLYLQAVEVVESQMNEYQEQEMRKAEKSRG